MIFVCFFDLKKDGRYTLMLRRAMEMSSLTLPRSRRRSGLYLMACQLIPKSPRGIKAWSLILIPS